MTGTPIFARQNHGLVVPHFGRFGWQRRTAPYFDFLQSFGRRYGAAIVRQQARALEVDLGPWEDFNFAKARPKRLIP